jgi:two-component system CheB/CheR fusion protein
MEKHSSSPGSVSKSLPLPFVAIGASAGGLEAVTQLIRNLPSDTGMSFIYVQHLSPDYKSMLASLLSKSTNMKVIEAKNGTKMKADHFYVIPPNREMSVANGHIKLVPRKKDRLANLPINIFFTSLAEKHKEQVIGIILSGTGTDGTKGLRSIKQEGGLTFAQDSSAKFSGMPESAIREGAVDFILSPKEIAASLVNFSKSLRNKGKLKKAITEDEIETKDHSLKRILQLVYQQKGMDFSHYKMNTIRRRIIRRVQMHKLKNLRQYADLLKRKEDELDMLCQDLLINVTSFYRDTGAFAYLKSNLFPKLLRSKTPNETLRLWIPACATGEEVYSIAMTLLELQKNKKIKIPVQIFATDLSAMAIRKARIGEYPEADLAAVPPDLIQKYFIKVKDHYRVGKKLRESSVFAQHNILYDPAFSNVDFISCCNLLIYLDTSAQKKVLATFHYALKENGYLMLSKSETVGSSANLFSPVNKKLKLYLRKKNVGMRTIPTITPRFSPMRTPERSSSISVPHNPAVNTYGHLGAAVDSVLLARYMPTCVVINYDHEILEVRGAAEFYLKLSPGKANLNILKMARPEIAFELRNVIHNAIKTNHSVSKHGIEVKSDTGLFIINLEATPLKIEGEEPLLLVLFSEQQRYEIFETSSYDTGTNTAKDQRIKKLEDELAASRSDLLSITHDHEATIEELQSSNEEVVSNNEELRTLNEELETSKEEIESTNDELVNANQKLQAYTDQVVELNRYAEAITEAMHNPMLVLDKDFTIKSANKPFYKQFDIKDDIEGQNFHFFNHGQWNIPQLRKKLEELIPKKTYLHNFELTHTFKNSGERIMLINARVTKREGNENLIVLVIEDITTQAKLIKKQMSLLDELKNANEELSAFNYVSSHDLQEPLRKVKTFANYILDDKYESLSETNKDYFKRMMRSVEQMETLIHDLLIYSRTTIKERKFEKTNIADVIVDVKKEFEDEIREKNAIIETGNLDKIETIRFQFRQLLLNLIGNSLKYSSKKRSPRILVQSEISKGKKFNHPELLPDVNYCHISVTDNGIGFEPKYKEQIFGVFERLHDRDQYNGTGIGLAICKKIVKNHNGFISATSKLNKGTTFDIYLPAENK